ncbi:MAG: ABC transporter permease [Treponema sp.]|jgi:phospholipid/cholesterol/gamma-HCH transport system permease protein|nr:ABC transporter permease [Treponema sp.]
MRITAVSDLFYALGFFTRLLGGVRHFMLRGRPFYKTLILQVLFTFVDALGITAFLAIGIGAAVNVIGIPFLSNIGQSRMIYPLIITIITRELGPLLAAFIVIARSATAIATEMAGMVVSHEIEAYISIGVDPIEQLGVPRFLGVTAAMFLLNIFFSLFGLAGSFAVAQLFNAMPAAVYFNNLLQSLTIHDLAFSVVKSLCFGMIISITAIIRGLSVDRASTEIPVAGLQAVSKSFMWCILSDIVLSALYYALFSFELG